MSLAPQVASLRKDAEDARAAAAKAEATAASEVSEALCGFAALRLCGFAALRLDGLSAAAAAAKRSSTPARVGVDHPA